MSKVSYLLKVSASSKLFQQLLFDVCDFSLVQQEDKGFIYSPTLKALKELVKEMPSEEYEIEALAEDGWRDKWTDNLEPVEISSLNLKIIPHISDEETTKRYSGNEIGLFPGRSFGIGHHETTKIMLQLFGRHVKLLQGANILDFGCGSGILGIVTSRLGASSVLSIDVDDEALRVTNINALLNQVKNLKSSKSLQGQFDVLVINNLPQVIEKEYPRIRKYLAPVTSVFASGFYKDQMDGVAKLLNVEPADTLENGDWVGFYGEREPHPAAHLLKPRGKLK